jgi:hypothetical protein
MNISSAVITLHSSIAGMKLSLMCDSMSMIEKGCSFIDSDQELITRSIAEYRRCNVNLVTSAFFGLKGSDCLRPQRHVPVDGVSLPVAIPAMARSPAVNGQSSMGTTEAFQPQRPSMETLRDASL